MESVCKRRRGVEESKNAFFFILRLPLCALATVKGQRPHASGVWNFVELPFMASHCPYPTEDQTVSDIVKLRLLCILNYLLLGVAWTTVHEMMWHSPPRVPVRSSEAFYQSFPLQPFALPSFCEHAKFIFKQTSSIWLGQTTWISKRL
jgi:hypothetical protein